MVYSITITDTFDSTGTTPSANTPRTRSFAVYSSSSLPLSPTGVSCSSYSSSPSNISPLKLEGRPQIKLGSITRAFRHYYKTGVIKKVPNKYKYQFGDNATNWRLGVQRKKARESMENWEKCMEAGKQTELELPYSKASQSVIESVGLDVNDEDIMNISFLDCDNFSPAAIRSENQSGISQ